ncbi:MAG: patatin-like phospholipase family protein, partial [Gammaproteobacteria bacterium]|nr:patatin-like phospholipase family protein [Gammaproteobacteria bacterium]
GSFGSSDLAAEFYDREVFEGGTYADVIARGRRPFVILNATDMSTGQRFPFIQDQFDLICSDLAAIPVAREAAASSAFPLGLTPLTFENHAGTCGYTQPAWVALAESDRAEHVNMPRIKRADNRLSFTATGAARRDYVHLTDGGVSDNLGLRGPLTAIATSNHPWSILTRLNRGAIQKLVVIVVNSASDPSTDRDRSPGVPGLVDTLSTAANVPIDTVTSDSIEQLRLSFDAFNQDARLVKDCKALAASLGPQCTLDLPTPDPVELYVIEVAFDFIADPTQRHWFKNIPTNFGLPRETIDRLRETAGTLLRSDPQFVRLMADLKQR